MSENLRSLTGTLSLYDVVVNSVHYREGGHRDDRMNGDLYLKPSGATRTSAEAR